MTASYPAPFCLVLSGGGAKGMYHIGVWRALRELGVPVNAFIGNSIGAIISAFLAQGLYGELERIGDTIGIDTIVKLPHELVRDGGLQVDRERLAAFRRFSKEVLEHRGLDTSPLRQVIYDTIDEDAIRNSGNDLGVVTFNVSDMRPREVFIEDMEPGQLRDYILASAAFPGFDSPVIDGKKHIDGGVYNNLPYDLATSRGYRNIIVVDIAGAGVNRRINTTGTNTIHIKISMDIGGVLDFDREILEELRTLGYLDTLKTFGRVVGNRYFIDADDRWERAFAVVLEKKLGADYREQIAERKVMPATLRHERRLLYPLLDATASALRIDRIRRYTYEQLFDAIGEAKQRIEKRVAAVVPRDERRFFMKTARRIMRARRTARDLQRSPYYYSRLLSSSKTHRPGPMTARTLRAMHPELVGALFLLPLLDETRKQRETEQK